MPSIGRLGDRLRSPRAKWSAAGATSVGLVVLYYVLPLWLFGAGRPVLSWFIFGVALVLLATLVINQIRIVVRASAEDATPGIMVALVLVMVVFATEYLVLDSRPGSFSGLHTHTDALYFTVTTLATVGFGDIYPVSQPARAAVMLQILFNLAFVGTAVSAFGAHARKRADRIQSR